MQFSMSSVPAPDPTGSGPIPVPQPPAPGPQVVRPRRPRHRRVKYWLSAVLVLLTAAALGYYLRSAWQQPAKGKGGGGAAIRTVPVVAGDLQQTVRLTGVVQAERFAALLAPRLRGSRSDRGRAGGNASYSASTPMSSAGGIAASSGSGSSGGSSFAGSGGSSGGALGGSVSGGDSAGGASSGGSSRGGTGNRFSDTGRSSGGGRSGGGADAAPVVSVGRGSGGGTRGGGSDFSLVLLSCARPGSFVRKGDVVAEFDRQNMLLRLEDYRASVDALELNIRKLKTDLKVAKEAHNQMVKTARADLEQTLLDLKTVEVHSEIQAERLRLAVEEARSRLEQVTEEMALFDASQRAQLNAAEIDYRQAQMELKRSEANVDRMVLKAPIDGLVVMQTIFRGGEFGQIREGDQVPAGMFFMSIVDPSSMVVNATVNQADSEKLRLNMKARVQLDAYNDLELPATIIGVGAMTRPAGWRGSYVREIPVRLKLDAMDPRVIPDLTASADVVLRAEHQAVIAPREAIFREGPAQAAFVYLRGPAGWMRRPVEIGLESNIAVTVRSGLRKGDVLAAERPLS